LTEFDTIDEENFLLFCAAHYYSPRSGDVDDFYADIDRIKYIKRLVNKFLRTGNLSERLLLNHIIVVANSFTVAAALRIFEYKLNTKSMGVIKPFLVYLNYIRKDDYPHIVSNVESERKLKEI